MSTRKLTYIYISTYAYTYLCGLRLYFRRAYVPFHWAAPSKILPVSESAILVFPEANVEPHGSKILGVCGSGSFWVRA